MEWHGYDAILLGSTVYSAASVKKPVVQPSSFAAVRFMQVEPPLKVTVRSYDTPGD